ncbi:MAG: hypothetical protein QE263_08500 [Vampirovibrionales bacterium]|nr:hypothetical protein [Vampirovibrionales bacterium]
MRFHFTYTDGSWSDLAEYEAMPAPRSGGVWTEGEPAENSPLNAPVDAAEYARQVLLTLSVESRARHYTHIANIAVALDRGDTGVAQYILANSIQPITPEETAVLTQLQTAFASLLGG